MNCIIDAMNCEEIIQIMLIKSACIWYTGNSVVVMDIQESLIMCPHRRRWRWHITRIDISFATSLLTNNYQNGIMQKNQRNDPI